MPRSEWPTAPESVIQGALDVLALYHGDLCAESLFGAIRVHAQDGSAFTIATGGEVIETHGPRR